MWKDLKCLFGFHNGYKVSLLNMSITNFGIRKIYLYKCNHCGNFYTKKHC